MEVRHHGGFARLPELGPPGVPVTRRMDAPVRRAPRARRPTPNSTMTRPCSSATVPGSGWTPSYAFGNGVGYTDWTYESIESDGTSVTVTVRNSGSRTGREAVQPYAAHRGDVVPAGGAEASRGDPLRSRCGRHRAGGVLLALADDGGPALHRDGRPRGRPPAGRTRSPRRPGRTAARSRAAVRVIRAFTSVPSEGSRHRRIRLPRRPPGRVPASVRPTALPARTVPRPLSTASVSPVDVGFHGGPECSTDGFVTAPEGFCFPGRR